MIGRLILSDRNIFKIKSGSKQVSARKCNVLSELKPDILVKTSKEFSSKDEYVKFDPNTNTLIQGLGQVGLSNPDLDIFYHLFTNEWSSKIKYSKLWMDYLETNPSDLAINYGIERTNYLNKVITIDPNGSLDLDDGFSFSYNDDYWNLDIHIADPVSWFDLKNEKFNQIFRELMVRLQSCYLTQSDNYEPTHLLPTNIVNLVSLLEIKSDSVVKSRRAITFEFVISKQTMAIEGFNIAHTNLWDIKNYTYTQYDEFINSVFNTELKTELVKLSNGLRDIIGLSVQTYPNVDLNNNISHRMIEIFMILTNWKGGNYLVNNLAKPHTIIRTQDKKDFGEDFDIQSVPEYARPYLSSSANYIKYNISPFQTHYSLGISNYAHLSSPMRRFIDMLNHLGFYGLDLECIVDLDLDKINSQIKNQKKISNGWNLFKFIKSNPESNKFRACLFDWVSNTNSNKINGLLVLKNKEQDFISVVNVELPQIESTINLTKYMEWDIELYYNSSNFKSTKFPFSIKII
jgi:hypothetical protein